MLLGRSYADAVITNETVWVTGKNSNPKEFNLLPMLL
jgi:hypothetical protein